jgi:hypothetical protein
MKRKTDKPASSTSKARTYEELGKYWDAHDLTTEKAGAAEDFSVDIRRRRYLVANEPKLFAKVRRQATKRGLSAEGLLNLWVREKCAAGR